MEKVRNTSFDDAKNTSYHVGQPSLEFAPFQRVYVQKSLEDSRQGTIDQDPEFKAFLESLTAPLTKPAVSASTADMKPSGKEVPKTTPLIEHLREKKLIKENNQASRNAVKLRNQQAKEVGTESQSKKLNKKESTPTKDKGKKDSIADGTAKDGVKVLKKEVISTSQGGSSAGKSPTTAPVAPAAPSAPTTQSSAANSSPKKRRERGSASIAAMMLQRDLGIGSGASSRRRSKLNNVNDAASDGKVSPQTNPSKLQTTAQTGSSPSKFANAAGHEAKSQSEQQEGKVIPGGGIANDSKIKKSTSQTTSGSKQSMPAAQPPKGPAASRPKGKPPAGTASSSENAAVSQGSSVRANAHLQQQPLSRQAFLKHANASQGITEPLLHDAMSVYGEIEQLTIDKRKGFAYVDFTTPEGLRGAMVASPVSVAQGAVVVLERRDKPVHGHGQGRSNAHPPKPLPHSNGGGRGGGGGGGGAAAAAAAAVVHTRGGSGKGAGSGRSSRHSRGGRTNSPTVTAHSDKVQSLATPNPAPAMSTSTNVTSTSAG